MTRYPNFCSACAVTVVIFGHLNRFLLTYLLTRKIAVKMVCVCVCVCVISLLFSFYNASLVSAMAKYKGASSQP